MSETFVIGIDIGTTGCRAAVYGSTGRLVASSEADYPLVTPKAGWVEQDPDVIYQCVVLVVSAAVVESRAQAPRIAGLCFSTVFHSLIPVDAACQALHPMLTWADSRSQKNMARLADVLDIDQAYDRTGCPLHPMYPLAKILWFRDERPAVFARTAKFLSIKEFVLYRLAGIYAVDRSLASGTGLYDIHRLRWDPELLQAAGLTEDRLSPVHATTHVVPRLTPEAATLLGLPVETPVVIGAGDGVLSTLGAGAIKPGQLTLMIGTSGALRLVSATPRTDRKSRNWCYNLSDDLWVVGGAVNNGGLALQWLRDKFNLGAYDDISRIVEQVPLGADGLVLLPLFCGERSPYWNANARGVLFGLNLNHGDRHLARATFEGVAYALYSVFLSLQGLSLDISEVRASGSFTRSPFWVQLVSDVFGRAIVLPGDPEGAAFGAAVLGLYGLGHLASLEQINQLVGAPKRVFQPDLANHGRYSRLHQVYERVYRNLQKEFDEIAAIQSEWAEIPGQ